MMALFHGIAPTKVWVSPKAILQNMGMARTSGFEKWDGFAPEIARFVSVSVLRCFNMNWELTNKD
jgi:hypothetical protein